MQGTTPNNHLITLSTIQSLKCNDLYIATNTISVTLHWLSHCKNLALFDKLVVYNLILIA